MTKTIVISDRSYKDTRGLPETMDPRMFYEYSSQLRHKQANGLEGLLYKILPRSLFKSLAFAIDPFSELKVSLGRISPMVRVRTHKLVSILDQRKLKWHRYSFTKDDRFPPGSKLIQNSEQVLPAQLPLESRSSDSTRRLRVRDSDQGEFSSWSAYPESGPRQVRWDYRNNAFYTGNPGFYVRSIDDQIYTWSGASARIDPTLVSTLRLSEEALASTLMSKHALSMFKGILPRQRQYTLFRNLVELRDLPRGVVQLRNTILQLRNNYAALKIPHNVQRQVTSVNTTLKNIPKEWLSYAFGWRQTYSDLIDLLLAPPKIGKRVDFLIRRANKPTTFRSKRTYSSGGTTSAGFIYDGNASEYTPVSEHSLSRETELRMVVNATIPFPGIDVPKFRRRDFLRRMGDAPTFTDMYNLVPWTWLVDWFTGLGDYVQIMDNILQDRTLINWGVITAETHGQLTTRYRSKSRSTVTTTVNTVGTTEEILHPHNHSSTLHFTSHLRKDVASIFDVNVATDMTTLTPYQQSILGALLSTRIVFRR